MKLLIICYIILFTQTCLYLSVSAQKLPNKQIVSVWAPSVIKIDGRVDEWNNKYQAYNKATEISYTISNDDKNLYLIAYITSPEVLFNKVMTGGITFQIKNNDSEVSIRYPSFDKPLPAFRRLQFGEKFTSKEDDPIIVKDNTTFTNSAKEIEVIGINGVENSISIYNEYGIKVAGRFDEKQGYIYELAIPLKYLNPSSGDISKLSYKMMVMGKNMNPLPTITSIGRADGSVSTSPSDLSALNQKVQGLFAANYALTDFSGEYTLAKK